MGGGVVGGGLVATNLNVSCRQMLKFEGLSVTSRDLSVTFPELYKNMVWKLMKHSPNVTAKIDCLLCDEGSGVDS